jgi:large subunit ribosomal protein L18
MAIVKKEKRMRRAKKTRAQIHQLQMPRLCVHRTPQHIYAQIIMPDGKVVTSASTLEKEVKKEVSYGGNVNAAKIIGKKIAERTIALNIKSIAFDRSGFRYHGRVQALADAAREFGLIF